MKLPRMLPIDPLLPWISECNENEGTENFAARCGVSAKRIADFTAGRVKRIPFDSVDKMLACEGSRSIIDFYPDYDSDSFADYDNVEIAPYKKENDPGCSVKDCPNAHHSKGLCSHHYNKQRRSKNKTSIAA